MSKVFFAFGPNAAYFLDTPKCYKSSGIPQKVWTAIGDDKIQTLHCLALDDDGEVFLAYRDENGKNWSWSSSDLKKNYPNLYRWLDEKGASGARVAFGARSSQYIAWHDNGASKWSYLPDKAEKTIQEDKRHIRCMALGRDGAYVILWKEGGYNWNLRSEYDQLDQLLDGASGNSVDFIALNPYKADQFFVVFNSPPRVVFCVDAEHQDAINDALRKNNIHSTALTSQRASSIPSLPTATKDKKFLKSVVGTIDRGATLFNIGTAVAGVVAATGCTIM